MGDPTKLRQTDYLPGHTNLRTTGQLVRAAVIAVCVSGALAACTSGDGGDNGNGNKGEGPGVSNPGQSAGLIFSYPVDGQTDVYSGSQIAFAFAGDASGKVQLVDADGHTVATKLVNQGNGIFNLRVADSDAALTPNTQYAVKADGKIGSGNTRFKNGQTLFSFTTAPAPGAASKKGFQIVSHRGDKNDRYPFTQFNPIRAKFSESVDEGSIKLCTGSQALGDDHCTVAITGPNGNVPGRLTVLGRNFVFDPGTGHVPIVSDDASDYTDQDLAANTSYKVAFSKQVHSAFGDALPSGQRSFSVTPVSIGKDVIQRLSIGDAGDGSNPLNGRARNAVELSSQLIGSYDLVASQLPNRGGLKVRLAAPGKADYKNTFPTELPRGQAFQLSALKLKLGSQLNSDGTYSKGQVDTPIALDHLTAQFADDVDAFITANSLRNIEKPTRVQLRLDLNISGKVPPASPIAALSNGVVNQTVLDITASGIAVPQDNGDVSLVTLGSFPIKVNRDGVATTNFELELTLPASADDQPDVRGDQTAPFITAQYPSACGYTFNTVADNGNEDDVSTDEDESARPLFASGGVVGGVNGTTTLSDMEGNCIDVLGQRRSLSAMEDTTNGGDADATYTFDQPWANSMPLSARPSVLFSEAIDPQSLDGNVTLMDSDGNIVTTRDYVEGSSVVVNPAEPLAAAATYTLVIGGGITDMSGNAVANTSFPNAGDNGVDMITFNTEPMVVPTNSDGSYVDLSDDLSQRPAVRQTAPFITALTPGLACALRRDDNADFWSGGNTAGNCVGDSPTQLGDIPPILVAGGQEFPTTAKYEPFTGQDVVSAKISYPVFDQPANRPVTAYFSKPVRSDSIRLADGCLIGGDGNSVTGATVAIQKMNGSQCTGVVDGALAYLDGSRGLSNGFRFTPSAGFGDQRYWVVICGSTDAVNTDSPQSQCSSGATVTGQNGLRLNTTPFLGTGTQVIGNNASFGNNVATCAKDLPGSIQCFDDNRAQGGPDIVMPFEGAPASASYASTTISLPASDTNGNGFFDNTAPDAAFAPIPFRIAGQNTAEDRDRDLRVFDDTFGREYVQQANQVKVDTIGSIFGFSYNEVAFLGGARPIVVEDATTNCGPTRNPTFDNGTSVVGNGVPANCIPVSLLPGGLTTVTGLLANGIAPTGRILLNFPYAINDSGESLGQPQQGYIVPRCTGSFKGEDYDYQPCFVAALRLTALGHDGLTSRRTNELAVDIPEQDIRVNVFGPVAFEQNGRLVISVRNANTFAIAANVKPFGTVIPAITLPGDQALQLVSESVHGGLAFP